MLHIVKGSKAPDTDAERVRKRVRSMPRPADMAQCPRCGGREVIETRTGVLLKDGRPTGGTKALICAGCHRRGERVVIA